VIRMSLDDDREKRRHGAEERLRLIEETGGLGTFDFNRDSGEWDWSPQVGALFGVDRQRASPSFADWETVIFVDDVPKLTQPWNRCGKREFSGQNSA
jgi:PAS domain-containing protein